METVTSKVCFKCHRELPITEFYRHIFMADGHLGKCKECTRRDVTEHRNANIEKVRLYDRERSRRPGRKAQYKRKDYMKRKSVGPDYDRAHNAIARAVSSGLITRPATCSRCPSTDRIQAHHDDHSKPLEVMWLCPMCHANRHKELGRLRMIRKAYGSDPALNF